MRIVDVIEKKRDGFSLTKEEINFFITNYMNGNIKDYQASSLLMAIYLKGMDDLETTFLTEAILNSGDTIDLSEISGVKVDKHSTGGVGDKTSLVLGPLVASLDVKFAKMSGRGLGHTGGTIDKLEGIEGYQVSLKEEDFINQVNDIGLAIIGQTGNLAPADKMLYALRDVTGTVSSIPLIASSIMSKKLASGADVICLDVKVGSGAFMKTYEDAKKLAQLMVKIGKNMNKKVIAVLTDMDEPLGYAIGNNLEMHEAIATLKGKGPEDLEKLCLIIGSHLVHLAGKAATFDEAYQKLKENLHNGKALEKLTRMIHAQKGNEKVTANLELLPVSKTVIPVISKQKGIIKAINALDIGIASMLLGAGRETKESAIDMTVGVILNKKINDHVAIGDVLAYVYANGKNIEEAQEKILKAFDFGENPVRKNLILDEIL